MDIWADDFDLSPAVSHRGRDPRKVVIAALVAAIVVIAVITVLVRDGDRPHHIAAADEPDHDTSPSVDDATTTTEPATTSTTSDHEPATTTVPGIPVNPEGDGPSYYVGRAVDPEGRPLAAINVYVRGFPQQPNDYPNVSTAPDGTFILECHLATRGFLLSGPHVNWDVGITGDASLNWAPVPVSSPRADRCGPSDHEPIDVVMRPGGVIEGDVLDPDGNRATYESGMLRVAVALAELPLDWFGDEPCVPFCPALWATVPLPSGTSYRIVGVPPGDVPVAVPDKVTGEWVIKTVHVTAGETTRVDVEVPPFVWSPPA